MRRLSLNAFLAVILPATLLMAFGAGCTKEETAAPPPIVRKTVPKAVAKAQEAAQPATQGPEAAKPAGEPVYSAEGKRDPFLPYLKEEPRSVAVAIIEDVPPLQRYEVAEFKLVGVIWGRRGYKALVEDREGKGYTVSVGTKLGRGNGTVARISDRELVVKEEISDYRGKKLAREISLKLQSAGGK
jgi:type IV pilus assembly protein PilP